MENTHTAEPRNMELQEKEEWSMLVCIWKGRWFEGERGWRDRLREGGREGEKERGKSRTIREKKGKIRRNTMAEKGEEEEKKMYSQCDADAPKQKWKTERDERVREKKEKMRRRKRRRGGSALSHQGYNNTTSWASSPLTPTPTHTRPLTLHPAGRARAGPATSVHVKEEEILPVLSCSSHPDSLSKDVSFLCESKLLRKFIKSSFF